MSRKKDTDSDDLLKTYFDQVRNFPLISFEEELELSKRIQKGDKGAEKKLVEANLRLVIKIAKAYLVPGVAFLDLIQEGNLGLMHAAEKFDHARSVHFSTYANWWIRQGIIRYLANRRRMIRLPLRKEEILRKIRKVSQTLSQRLSRSPNTEEISAETGLSIKEIDAVLTLANNIIPAEGDDSVQSNPIEFHEDYTYSPEQVLLRENSCNVTMGIVNSLKNREKNILIYRYQLTGGERYTLKTISDKMGISPETVRQIELRALRKMRENAEELAECLA
jgi:RNA polymerase primary sigma factor